jgi:hypothetical protein
MSTSEMVRAAVCATAMWIAFLGAMLSSGDNRPSLVDRSGVRGAYVQQQVASEPAIAALPTR